MKYKIKIITGFRKDQEYLISAEEAHKAYYLFLNPDKRSIFDGGLAILGAEIRRIEPDYNGTMGWNPTYQLTDDDWNEIKNKGIDRKLQRIITISSDIAKLCSPEDLAKPITQLTEEKYKYLLT
jgi:hypothetical protein